MQADFIEETMKKRERQVEGAHSEVPGGRPPAYVPCVEQIFPEPQGVATLWWEQPQKVSRGIVLVSKALQQRVAAVEGGAMERRKRKKEGGMSAMCPDSMGWPLPCLLALLCHGMMSRGWRARVP